MPSSLQLAAGDPALMAVVRQCRQLLHRRAMVAGVASAHSALIGNPIRNAAPTGAHP